MTEKAEGGRQKARRQRLPDRWAGTAYEAEAKQLAARRSNPAGEAEAGQRPGRRFASVPAAFWSSSRAYCLLLSAFCLLVIALFLLPAPAAAGADPRRTPVVDVVERVRGAVVNIHSERTVLGPASEDLFKLAPSQNRINGMGTGVLIDPRGYIVSNEHVVEDVNVIRVRLSDGAAFNARVLARDQENDLALLKIDAHRPLPIMPLGTARDLMVGETVIAIGNAYGYEHTVTVGVVSALNRDVTLNKDVSYKSLIQTDASINPGNSGGPLLNINGEMVGLNVAIRAGAQGISFAIPVDRMMRVAADMLSARRQKNLWHGLICSDRVERSPSAAAEGMMRNLVVERTDPSGPAAHAGMRAGDVIVRVADVRVTCRLEMERALLEAAPGDHVPVTVRRQAAEQRFELVLESADQETGSSAALIWRKLGLRLAPARGELVSRTNPQLQGGLSVVEVNPEAAAAKAGIQRGDILVGLHQWKTLTLDNVAFVLSHRDLASFNPLCFYIIRSGQVHRGWLQQVE